MSVRPSQGIGARLAKYRRHAGLSARELSEQAGWGLTRGVIANIESGRKTDITSDQLIALSSVLGVPPVVLAAPIEEPYRFVRMNGDPNHRHAMRAHRLADWFQTGDLIPWVKDEGSESEATAIALAIIRETRRWVVEKDHLKRVVAMHEEGAVAEEVVRERELEVRDTERTLRQLGVDMTVFKVDE